MARGQARPRRPAVRAPRRPAAAWHGLKVASLCLAALATAPPALAEITALRRGGDLLRGLLPLAAALVAVEKEDHEGLEQFGLTLVASELTTESLKHTFNATAWGRRPDGGPNSFPSGHATTACSSAFFLGERYGWRYGAPALLPAGVVMYSRIDARAHRGRDVVAGCSIGAGFASGLVTERTEGPTVRVQVLRRGAALSLSLPL